MRENKSDRGGVDGALDRSLDSDGRNSDGVEKRLGRNYSGMKSRGRGKGSTRKSKSRSARRA
jgi:hypothetical protein